MPRKRDDIRLLDQHWDDEDDEGGEDTGEVEPLDGEVLTYDDELLKRLENLERLLGESVQQNNLPATRRQDDFSLTGKSNNQEEILIRIQDRLSDVQGGDLSDDIAQAVASLIGASYGAQLMGSTGAGIGAALASLLHNRTKRKNTNPLDIIFGNRR